jgi:hypothetical protein
MRSPLPLPSTQQAVLALGAALAAAALLILSPQPSNAQGVAFTYTVTDLGVLPNDVCSVADPEDVVSSVAEGINESGQIAGTDHSTKQSPTCPQDGVRHRAFL